jgi:hypothetical protein
MTHYWVRRAALVGLIALIVMNGVDAGAAAKKRVAKAKVKSQVGEISLIGINLYDPVQNVIKKFGNPDSVRGVYLQSSAPSVTSQQPGVPSTPGMPSNSNFGAPSGTPPGTLPGVGPSGSGPYGSSGGAFGGPGASPFQTPVANAPTTPGSGPTSQTMLIYVKKGSTYSFIINDKGRVVQIGSIAERDAATKTRKGITLGSTYGEVLKVYGYPEMHEFQGSTIMLLKYLKKQHVAFQLFNQKVVGITIAAGVQ